MSSDVDSPAILNDLRKAVAKDWRTPRAILHEAGIHPRTFYPFMKGHRGLSVEAIEQLAKALGFRLRLVPAAKPRHGGR